MTLLAPNPYTVHPGQCPVHEVMPDQIADIQALSAQCRQRRAETILQQAVKPWPSYWRMKEKQP